MKYIENSEEGSRKLRYLGYCSKCKKNTNQRFRGSTWTQDFYECIKCKTRNIDKK